MHITLKSTPFALPHICYLALLLLIAVPGLREDMAPVCFLLTATVIELYYIYASIRKCNTRAAGKIISIVFLVMMLWELSTTIMNCAHPILLPMPETVFRVFPANWKLMLRGFVSSISLLGTGFAVALPLGVILGALAGWFSKLREVCVPIARVMAPIPAIIYAPYLIAIMPTFRSASAMVLILGIFWPTFLQTVNRIQAIDRVLLDSACAMALTDAEMIFQIFTPWILPGILSGFRITLSTSFMLLTLAEMMGANSGLGYFIKNYADYANYANVLAGIILIALVVTAMNMLVAVVERKFVAWS